MTQERMPYRRYKQHFADCDTLGDYDKATKTITVLVPAGRMKPSGVRGQRYHYFRVPGVEDATGRKIEVTIKAICFRTCKQHLKTDYPGCTFDTSAWE